MLVDSRLISSSIITSIDSNLDLPSALAAPDMSLRPSIFPWPLFKKECQVFPSIFEAAIPVKEIFSTTLFTSLEP